jgi:hypothetical protein
MPLSPSQALVASWHDGPDPSAVGVLDSVGAMSLNHHTAKHRVDWLYWQPGSQPRRGHPLHDRPISGPPPAHSVRRDLVMAHIEGLLETRRQTITVFNLGG